MAEPSSQIFPNIGDRGPIRLNVHPLINGATRLFKAQLAEPFCKGFLTFGDTDNRTWNWITLKNGGPE
jgi:hypothetical protein